MAQNSVRVFPFHQQRCWRFSKGCNSEHHGVATEKVMSSGTCVVLAISMEAVLQTAAGICLQTAVLYCLETLRWEQTAVCSIHRLITPKLPLAFSFKTLNYWVCIILQQLCCGDRVYGVMSVLLQHDLRAKWMPDSQLVEVLMELGSIFLRSHISGWCVIIINEEHLPVGVLYFSREALHTWTPQRHW